MSAIFDFATSIKFGQEPDKVVIYTQGMSGEIALKMNPCEKAHLRYEPGDLHLILP